MKITENELIEIAEKYCRDKTPLSVLAQEYGVSKTTLVRYFNGERSIKLPLHLQQNVDIVKEENWIDYKSTSGNLGHKSLTDDETKELAQKLTEHGLSLNDLVTEDGPCRSTLYNLFTESVLGKELYEKVQNQYKENKSNSKK